MNLTILNKEGKKVSEKETMLFEEPVRKDIIAKVVEAEKIWQPYASKFRAGMDRSASGNVSHRRHRWKSDRGRGLARIPKKAFWRRGTQFSWEGAIVPGTKGGRKAHPPKGSVNLKKINKKELKKALLSALSYVSDVKEVKKKYGSSTGKKIDVKLPLVVDNSILNLKIKQFAEALEKILGGFYSVAAQKKFVRAGKGKMRGRKYKKSAGLLMVVEKDEDIKIKGIEIIKVPELIVSDLASNGARLCIFSEKAVEELEGVLMGEKNKKSNLRKDKDGKSGVKQVGDKKKKDKRKLKKEKRKNIRNIDNSKQDKESEVKVNKSEQTKRSQSFQNLKVNNINKNKEEENA